MIGFNTAHSALTSNTTYTIEVYRMNSTGTTALYSSTTATTNADGKLSFDITNIPTNADCRFIIFTIKDGAGAIVRRGFSPAPPAGATNLTGINALSTPQTNCLLTAAAEAGSDDPILIAYALMLLRSPNATTDDATNLANVGKAAIIGSGGGGFEPFLLSHGVSAQMLADFKNYLIYNPTTGKKTLADFTAGFKTAVDSSTADAATQEMQKAGGLIAEIFMDAAEAAGFNYGLLLAANDAAGDIANQPQIQAYMLAIAPTVQNSIQQSLQSFNMRIASVKVKAEYTKALTTLNASGEQVDRFNSAVATMIAGQRNIDSLYCDYYANPAGYIVAHSTTYQAVQNAINTAFQTVFSTFQDNIASTNADITAMKAAAVSGFGIAQNQLPNDFGTYRDFTGTQKNWPIPQTVMVTWLTSHPITYTRDTLAIPSGTGIENWLGTCSNTSYWDKQSCQNNSGTWTAQRRTYTTPSVAFNAYLGLMEDVQIIQNTQYSIYQQEQQPTKAQEQQAKLDFETRMAAAASRIGGTGITDEQKMAIIKLCVQPSTN